MTWLLRVRTELGGVALLALAGAREVLENLVAVVDRRRHQLRRLAAGIAEHDALVAGAFLRVRRLLGIDALGDVGRLPVQQHLDVRVGPVEAFLLVADVADRLARDVLDQLRP